VSFAHKFKRISSMRLRRSGRPVLVGDAQENLGYAGGINAWLLPLIGVTGWSACWILNPDAQVTPDALTALSAQALNRNLGIVGSRIMTDPGEAFVATRGLRWRKFLASVSAVDKGSPASIEPDPEAIEARLDAASGASLYMTRPCTEKLVPFDEKYFLYYEDLDWGIRARRAGYRVGYAHGSIVYHPGGNSIGTPSSRDPGSTLAVFLLFRNTILFAKTHYPYWWLWVVLITFLHAVRLVPQGRFGIAVRGLFEGALGKTGRPNVLVAKHRVPGPRHSLPVQHSLQIRALQDASRSDR
jgi:N-acetylglucosaminyl-diphospho-decaprenol L-rhamnosyltransferase